MVADLGTKVLDYARLGLEHPPRTRVVVQRAPQGLRFIDPPLAGTRLRQRILLRLASQTIVILIVMPVFFMGWRLSRVGVLIGVIAVTWYNGWFLLRYWRHSGRYPTVIDITPTALAVTLPGRKRIFMPFSELTDIRASRPRRQLGVQGRVSSLLISTGGRTFWLLRYRDYAEVRWLARQLRLSVGRTAEHPSEPVVRIDADTQEIQESESDWAGPLPAMPQPDDDAGTRTRRTFGQIVSHEYDHLGCAAGLCLYLSIVVGAFFIGRLVGDLMIRLQFGANAYFQQGLRFVPHHEPLLTNGQRLGPLYRVLSAVLSGIGIITWMAVALPIAFGFNRLSDAIHAKRRKALSEQTRSYVTALDDKQLTEYVQVGTSAYRGEAVAFAREEYRRRALDPRALSDVIASDAAREAARISAASEPLDAYEKVATFLKGMGNVFTPWMLLLPHPGNVYGEHRKNRTRRRYRLAGFLSVILVLALYVAIRELSGRAR